MTVQQAAALLDQLDRTHDPRGNGSALLTQLNGGYGPLKRTQAVNAIRVLVDDIQRSPGSPFGDAAA